MQPITTPEQYIDVCRSAGVHVILCSADWCKVCQEVAKPKLIAMMAIYDAKFWIVDEDVEHADAHEVKKLPTVLVYKNGHPICMHVGGDMTPVENILGHL